MVTVQELHIYPMKSARGIPVADAVVGPAGLAWDRHWMLTDLEGNFLTQRTHPVMARIRAELTGVALRLRLDEGQALELPLEARGEARPVRVWKDLCEGLDQGEEAAGWASAALGQPVRVMRVPPQPRRLANADHAGPGVPVGFPDGFPVLVCNRASLEDLNARLPDSLPIGRFRPNLVLEGLPPWAEDRIESLCIGGVRLKLVKPCTRCVITATDQVTGDPGLNPLPVLRTFRWNHALKGVTFGENAVPVAGFGERIERGAVCEVTYRQP
ncbi:MAG TPA: MOSC N-terminal beta barrel domain-containing protein [Steroidobacteraceae bacterium]|nr:MOSC N-terminal beta barrel domain-containing protein [Steroidobacteraceae bacterium]